MRLLLVLFLSLTLVASRAEQVLELKPHDVIALVGGEDMVAASELGYLEAFLQSAVPDHRLKIRSLAWEGDTVFEQRRDLNYPNLETQLEKIGATVVLARFGQIESLGGTTELPKFLAAYEALLTKLSGAGKRRVAVILPNEWSDGTRVRRPEELNVALREYTNGIAGKAPEWKVAVLSPGDFLPTSPSASRDGLHLSDREHRVFAGMLALVLAKDHTNGKPREFAKSLRAFLEEKGSPSPAAKAFLDLVVAKNRLWFDYSRPQNWAFLAGDRTNQPSSRDHLDRNKRWFPEELERFIPLMEAKEKEIWDAAAKLNDRKP